MFALVFSFLWYFFVDMWIWSRIASTEGQKKREKGEEMDGFRLRELRKMVGLRQVEVALELGVDNETVCRWERSGRKLTVLQERAVMELVRDVERVAGIKGGRRRGAVGRRVKRLGEVFRGEGGGDV
jgi:DNA-binding transcriptional regulator YiaG